MAPSFSISFKRSLVKISFNRFGWLATGCVFFFHSLPFYVKQFGLCWLDQAVHPPLSIQCSNSEPAVSRRLCDSKEKKKKKRETFQVPIFCAGNFDPDWYSSLSSPPSPSNCAPNSLGAQYFMPAPQSVLPWPQFCVAARTLVFSRCFYIPPFSSLPDYIPGNWNMHERLLEWSWAMTVCTFITGIRGCGSEIYWQKADSAMRTQCKVLKFYTVTGLILMKPRGTDHV